MTIEIKEDHNKETSVKKQRRKRKTKEEKLKEEKMKELQSSEPVVKKKRGRKKKIKTPEEIEREKNKPKQRRGRKPKSLINTINSANSKLLLETSNNNSNETIILNLKINNSNDLNNKINNNEDNSNNNIIKNELQEIPLGYNINDNSFTSLPCNLKKNYDNDSINDIVVNKDNWATNNENTCLWCCHSFKNKPYGIPFKYNNNKFYVNGCFCTLECAAAYNFSEEKYIQDIWECYNLINLLSNKINYKSIVKLAPNRTALKMFGGNMEIDEFRSYTDNNKIINNLNYPMISVSQQIEEINYDNNYNKNDFIPIDENRIKKLEQKIKLMRTAPLLNNKNTLEHTMNIKIN